MRLVIPARDTIRATKTKDMIQRKNAHAEIIVLELDLSSFSSINRFYSLFLALIASSPSHVNQFLFILFFSKEASVSHVKISVPFVEIMQDSTAIDWSYRRTSLR